VRLKVSQPQLDYWIGEIDTPPRTVFFAAIGIIIENAGAKSIAVPYPRTDAT
jgi:hypothetical protein